MSRRAAANALVFLLGFCSICYELILASKLSRLSGKGIFLFPAVLAVFLLCMGAGSLLWYRRSRQIERSALHILMLIELFLTAAGFGCVLLVDASRMAVDVYLNLQAFGAGFMMAAAIGFLSGQELPLLFHHCVREGWGQAQVRRMFLFDYLAGFAASLAVTLLLFPAFGIYQSSVLVSTLNFFAMLLIFGLLPERSLALRRGYTALFAVIGLFYALFIARLDRIEDAIVTALYARGSNAALVRRMDTRYQQVLVFAGRRDGMPFQGGPSAALADPQAHYIYGFLNEALQFYGPLGPDTDPYHVFLVDPVVRLNPSARRALILGGGDGLPARQAVRLPQLERIDMVDLDGEWVEFTRTHSLMRRFSGAALDDPRLHLHYRDAFRWVLEAESSYDAVFVDFPEDDNVAAVRTVSLQFLRDLKRILAEDGAVVFQNVPEPGERLLRSAWRTALKAGLFPAYGRMRHKDRPWVEAHQLAVFKSLAARERYLDGFERRYLREPGFAPDAGGIGTAAYSSVEPAKRWISYYDPVILRLSPGKLLDALREPDEG